MINETPTRTPYQPLANREYKSSVFTTYFSDPKHAANLYQSLSNGETVQPEDIEFVTLDNAIYYGRTMERLIPANNIYKTKLIHIPTPEFYIFYNGTKQHPVESILKLSDAYIEKTDEPMLDLTVKMININPVNNHPILQKSRSMYEYSCFIQKVRDYEKPGEPLTNAIEAAIQDCLREGIMVDFLSKHGSEVSNMLFTEFNMEDALRVRGEEGYEDGLAEGKSSEIRTIRKKLTKNMPVSEIAEWFEIPETYISQIAALIQEYPDDTDVQIAERYFEKVKHL